MVKTPPTLRYGGSGAGAIRLAQQKFLRPGDEFEAPVDTDTKSDVTFLDPNDSAHLDTIGANPILEVEPVTFFLGAASTSNQRERNVRYYRSQWIFSNALKARRVMGAEYSTSQQVLVFNLPGLIFRMAEVTLLVAELNTAEPYRGAFKKLMRVQDDGAVRASFSAYLQNGRFHPNTLRDVVAFFLAGKPASAKKSWLLALTRPSKGRAKGRAFPPPASVYTVASREYARKPNPGSSLEANVTLVKLRWTSHTLGSAGRFKDKPPITPVEPFDTYIGQLLALRFG